MGLDQLTQTGMARLSKWLDGHMGKVDGYRGRCFPRLIMVLPDTSTVKCRSTMLAISMLLLPFLQPLYSTTYISHHSQLRTIEFCCSRVLLPACP